MRETPSATREAPGARFLFRLAKKARKRWTGLTTITQDPGDLLDSPLGQAVVNNASQHKLMRQSPQAIDRVGQAFALTAGERSYLLSCPAGHGLLLTGEQRIPLESQGEPRRARACHERPGRARGGRLKRAALSSCGLLLALPCCSSAAAVGVLGGGSGVSLGQPAAEFNRSPGSRRNTSSFSRRPAHATACRGRCSPASARWSATTARTPTPPAHRRARSTTRARAARCSSSRPLGRVRRKRQRSGPPDRWNAADAIFTAARYLKANGAPQELQRAIFAYNHSQEYVEEVLRWASSYEREAGRGHAAPASGAAGNGALVRAGSNRRALCVGRGEPERL